MQSRFRDWGDARIFLAVYREGSTLAAARTLGINQTTAARRIDVLEHMLGLTLFDKTTRGACPTEAAKRLAPLAEALEAAALALEAEAISEQGRALAPIRITAFDQMVVGDLGRIVSDFAEENSGTTFEFITTERTLDLVKGEADVAIRMSPAIKDERLIARKVGHTQWTYYASHAYAEKHGTPDAFTDDMGDHRVVLLGHITTKRKNVQRCVNASDLRTAIACGQGIGPIPTFHGDRDPDLVRCFDPPEGSDLNVWVVTSPEAHQRADVRKFTAFAAPRIARFLKGLD